MADAAPPLKALLVNDASLSGHHGSALVTAQLVRLAADAGIDVAPGWTWAAVTAALSGTGAPFDLVIVNGEGSLHGNSRAAERIAKIATDLALKATLPAYLVNATIEANSLRLDQDLGRFRLRFVRDTKSQAALARAHVSADVVHDLTLTASHLPRAAGRGALLVTDASDQATTQRLIALARSWPDAEAVTLRARPPWPARGDRSRRIAFEIKRQAALLAPVSPWSLRYGRTVGGDQLIDLLAHRSRGIVCGRYHAACIALRMGLPFVAIEGNTGKTGALLADVGLEHCRVSLAALEGSQAPFPIAPYSELQRERIERFLAAVESEAADMFRRIADDAKRWHSAAGTAVA